MTRIHIRIGYLLFMQEDSWLKTCWRADCKLQLSSQHIARLLMCMLRVRSSNYVSHANTPASMGIFE